MKLTISNIVAMCAIAISIAAGLNTYRYCRIAEANARRIEADTAILEQRLCVLRQSSPSSQPSPVYLPSPY